MSFLRLPWMKQFRLRFDSRLSRPSAASAKPAVEAMEDRLVPTVVSFRNGLLTVDLRSGERVAVVGSTNEKVPRDFTQYVEVNGTVNILPGGKRVRAQDVQKIRVIGSDFDDDVRLRNVDSRGFRGLNGKVEVLGNGGRDYVEGSMFNDIIRGGAGNDFLEGGLGSDKIYGDSGDDYLNGFRYHFGHDSDGKDTLDGGAGNDAIHGAAGADTFIGGPGFDIAQDYNPTKGDRKDKTVERW